MKLDLLISKIYHSCFFKTLFVSVIIVSVIVGALLYRGDIRHISFRLVGAFPSDLNKYILRSYIIKREFDKVAYYLDKELGYVRFISVGNNVALRRLLSNMQYSMSHAKTEEELDSLQEFLHYFVSLYPDVHLSRIWYAMTLKNDSPLDVFEQLDAAIKLVPSDTEIYRIGLDVANKNHIDSKVEFYCNKYNTEQLGGVSKLDGTSLFSGLSLRNMSLEVVDEQKTKFFSPNNGLSLGSEVSYEFSFPKKVMLSKLNLYLSSYPGLLLNINNFTLLNQGLVVRHVDPKDLLITSSSSFFIDKNKIIISNKGTEVIYITGFDETEKIDKVNITISTSRAELLNNGICEKQKL